MMKFYGKFYEINNNILIIFFKIFLYMRML